MDQDDRMTGSLQENILTLLCFSDTACKLIRNTISTKHFESSIYRDIASNAFDFIDQFGEAPKDHIPDTLEHILKGEDKRKATGYERVLDNIFSAANTVNEDYVLSQLSQFMRTSLLKQAIVKAVEHLQNNKIDEAELEITKALKSNITSFDAGTFFTDTKKSLAFFDEEEGSFGTGIAELDKRDIGPRRKELFLFIAPPKRGKTWALIHIGKHALLQRLKVLHITLEMRESKITQRYVQSFFSITKRQAAVKTARFEQDSLGRLVDIDFGEVTRPSFNDENIRSKLATKIATEFSKRPKLLVKQFPTGSLTPEALRAYLDAIERTHKFVPDMIILDYPDLMRIDSNNVRGDTSKIYKEVRGIAVERNLAMVAASQGNRASADAKVITEQHVAEDFSKIAIADNVITYNQTESERALNLARLYVSNGRNDEDKFSVLISQAYAMGQFALESTLTLSDYWGKLSRFTNSNNKEDDEDEDTDSE